MKKHIIFLALVLPVLFFSACNWSLPAAIEVNGTLENSIPAKMNVGTMFTDELESKFEDEDSEGQSIIICAKTSVKTFLIHVDLFNEDISPVDDGGGAKLPDFIDGVEIGDLSGAGYTVPAGGLEMINIDTPVTLPLSGLGDFLEGFQFKNPDVLLYFSGSDIIDKCVIEVTITNHEETNAYQPDEIENLYSGFPWTDYSDNDGHYTGTSRPAGGYTLNKDPSNGAVRFTLDGSDIVINFKIIVPAGKILTEEDFEEGRIKVELVVWLPLEFEVQDGLEEAKITFPEDFFGSGTDLFGRTKNDMKITEIIQNLKLDMIFDKNPFKGGELVVWSGLDAAENRKIEFKKVLNGNAFSIDMNDSTMKKINNPDNFPFSPNFEIVFDKSKNSGFYFPKDFTAVQLAFKARIKYEQRFR